MIVYIILYLGIVILSIIELTDVGNGEKPARSQVKLLVLGGALLLAIGCFRAELLGVDVFRYKYNGFEYYRNLSIINIIHSPSDIGYSLLNKVIGSFSDSFILFRNIIYIFNISVLCLFVYKNSNYYALSLLLYLAVGYLGFNFTILRESIAVSISLIGLMYLKKGRVLYFVLFVLIASLFHQTAFLCLIYLPLAKCQKPRSKLLTRYILFFIVLPVLFFSAPKIIKLYQRHDYTDNYSSGTGLGLLAFFVIIFVEISIFFRGNLKKNSIDYDLSLSVLFFQILAVSFSLFNRCIQYFYPPLIILLSNCISEVKNKKEKYLLFIFIGIEFSVLFFKNLIDDYTDIVPYFSLFNK